MPPRVNSQTLTVRFDERRCSGYASCELIAPDVFELDEDHGRAVLLADMVSVERLAALERAARSCPTNAISIELPTSSDG